MTQSALVGCPAAGGRSRLLPDAHDDRERASAWEEIGWIPPGLIQELGRLLEKIGISDPVHLVFGQDLLVEETPGDGGFALQCGRQTMLVVAAAVDDIHAAQFGPHRGELPAGARASLKNQRERDEGCSDRAASSNVAGEHGGPLL